MYVKRMRQKATGRVRLAIYENYREGGKHRSRTVMPLGYVDELEAEHEDPEGWARSLCEQMNAEREAERQAVEVTIHPLQLVDKRSVNRMCAGDAVALSVYAGLGIEAVLRNHMRGRRAGYDLNAVMRLLVAERIVEPGRSKLHAWEMRGRHFFRSDLSEDDACRALDELAAAAGKVEAAMGRAIEGAGDGRDMTRVYYDVTNYYFECDPDPPGEGYRARGVSKEHRPNPIARMGMLQDRDGVPIAHKVFRGNTQDGQTMIPVLAKMKGQHKLGRVVAVADKGLNNSDNIAALVARGDGFVFSQSLRGTRSTAKTRAWATSDDGWTVMDDFKMKSTRGHETLHLKAEDSADGRAHDIECEVKWLAMWSGKYERRARHEREKVLERARDLVAHPGRYTRHTHHGAAAYVRNIQFDDDGSVATSRELSIDEDAVAEAERYDGYYLVVTSEVGWSDQEVLDAYRGLWQIEESFKAGKTDALLSRPVRHRTEAHIEAHFLTCYVALVILRLLQRATGVPAARAREEIAAMRCSSLDANWWLFDHRTDESDRLLDAVGLPELKRKNMRTADIRSMFAKAKKGGVPHAKRS